MSLLKEGNGQYSIMRLMFALVIISGIVYAFINHDIAMTAMFFSYGFTGKYLQKKIEKKG